MWLKMILGVAMTFSFITSCKKSSNDTRPPRIRTVTGGGVTTTYTYDPQYRLLKAEPDQGFNKEEYLYEPGKVTWTKTEPSNSYTLYYYTGNNGYVESSQWAGSSEIDYYEYNDKGYITRRYNNKSPRSETVWHYNANGLLDSLRTTTGNIWNSTSVFMFYTDKKNAFNDEIFGRTFLGKQPGYPVKAIAVRRPDGNFITVSVTNYTYTYDSQGRISGSSFTTSGGQSGSETYTYY